MGVLAGLSKSNTDDGPRPDYAPRDETAFRRKVQGQQFLKHHGAILRALIRIAGDIDLRRYPGLFEAKVRDARTLAVKIVAKLHGKPEAEVTMEEAKPFRQEASEIVAWYWTTNQAFDADALAAEIAGAASIADTVYDSDDIPWRSITSTGSLAMTVVPAMMRLKASVDAYDFRLGSDRVLARLSNAVVTSAMEGVYAILPESSTEADRRSVFQSLVREYAADMQVVYDEAARGTVHVLVGMTDMERTAYLEDIKPVDTLIENFAGIARRNTALNTASIKAMLDALSGGETKDTPSP